MLLYCYRDETAQRRALDILIGVPTLGVIGNIMNLLNLPGYHQEVVQGVIILVAVLLQSSFWPRRA